MDNQVIIVPGTIPFGSSRMENLNLNSNSTVTLVLNALKREYDDTYSFGASITKRINGWSTSITRGTYTLNGMDFDISISVFPKDTTFVTANIYAPSDLIDDNLIEFTLNLMDSFEYTSSAETEETRFTASPGATAVSTPEQMSTIMSTTTAVPSITDISLPLRTGIISNSGKVNVRAESNIESEIMYSALPGEGIGIFGASSNSEWYLVQVSSGIQGWVKSEYIVVALPPTVSGESVSIEGIVSPGDINSEAITIRNIGQTVNLSGWTLTDLDGNSYVFEDIRIFAGGSITFNTRDGDNTAVQLFWGRDEAVFGVNGIVEDVAILSDDTGGTVAVYQVTEP